MMELRQISKTYRGNNGDTVSVLDNVSLQIPPGVFGAVSGPSGCGKSTLLLIAGALLHPDRGHVVIDGDDFTTMSVDQKASRRADAVGFVFQRFHLLPYLTVRENILAATVARKHVPAVDSESRADALMKQLGITHRAGHRPGQLSVGEMQRTALARALFNSPKVLLADEPTGNLDPENAEIVIQCFTDFAADGGAVLMVTHNPEDAAHAHTIWRLENGRTANDTADTSGKPD